MRLFLRLEFLFRQFHTAAAINAPWGVRYALQTLLELVQITGRGELRLDLRKELDRHNRALHALRERTQDDPDLIDGERLNETLEQINRIEEGVRQMDSEALGFLRRNEFLNTINQRSLLPGGMCLFDVPALHLWLHQDTAQRDIQLKQWFSPLEPIEAGVEVILHIVRGSADLQPVEIQNGCLQQQLEHDLPAQLLRLELPAELGLYPEISANRHRFTVRLMHQPDPNRRARISEDTVLGRLGCCIS